MSGTGSVKLGKDGRLTGKIRIKNGDDSTFIAERAEEPDEPIPHPPSYRDKWRQRWWTESGVRLREHRGRGGRSGRGLGL